MLKNILIVVSKDKKEVFPLSEKIISFLNKKEIINDLSKIYIKRKNKKK